ncbi:MAG TPA: hypothetical protein DCL15_20545 [Chloroflexi bacterium]|nr:hypothetical protein [Chloroflexota bacterium]HHW84930.1 filamentous hemagglutinin N-terminal domain-containing protein [Chloroflexota bacterium]
MKTWLWRGLILLGVVMLASAGRRLDAAPLDACQPVATENWATVSNWSCGHTPTSTDAVTIPLGVTLTLSADGDVGDLTLATPGTRLSLGAGVALNVYGTLVTTSTTTSATITGSGRLRMVGGSRTLFAPNWGAGSTGLRLEIALDSGAVGTSNQAIKGGEILIDSGTYSTTTDVRPDNGVVNSGRLDVAAGATLITAGNIERTATNGTQASSVIISGTLESSGAYISANTITIASGGLLRVKRTNGLNIAGAIDYATGSTLEYAGSVAQTTGGELTTTVANLTVANPAGVTLGKSATVNGQLALTGGGLATTGAYTLTLGDAATCTGDHEVTGVVQRINPSLGTGYCFGHPHTVVTFTTGALPTSVSVTLSQGTPPFPGAVARQYTLNAPGFTGAATVRLHYLDSELNGATEANLHLWRFDGARWRLMGRSTIDTTNNYVELTGVTAFSDWAIAEDGEPTAVTIVDFSAETQPDGVHLAWETADETLNAGFHVLRSDSAYSYGQRITTALIPSQTAGGVGGAHYTFVDTMPSVASTRFYWLEDVDLTGATALYGPVIVTQKLLWLPLIAMDK